MGFLLSEAVDWNSYPDTDLATAGTPKVLSFSNVTDNPLQLLYFLLREGICSLSTAEYTRCAALFVQPEFHLEYATEFLDILSHLEVRNKDTFLHFLGSETIPNYFSLKILEHLAANGILFEILWSPAHILFSQALNDLPTSPFRDLIGNEITDAAEIEKLADLYYANSSFLSWSLALFPAELTIFSHEKLSLSQIKRLATRLDVVYCADTPIDLTLTVIKINHAILETEGAELFKLSNFQAPADEIKTVNEKTEEVNDEIEEVNLVSSRSKGYNVFKTNKALSQHSYYSPIIERIFHVQGNHCTVECIIKPLPASHQNWYDLNNKLDCSHGIELEGILAMGNFLLLDLSDNSLYQLYQGLIDFLASIPASIRILRLNNCNLCSFTAPSEGALSATAECEAEERSKNDQSKLRSIPQNEEELRTFLEANQASSFGLLKLALLGIPETVEAIDLRGNGIEDLPPRHQKELLSVFPSTTQIILNQRARRQPGSRELQRYGLHANPNLPAAAAAPTSSAHTSTQGLGL